MSRPQSNSKEHLWIFKSLLQKQKIFTDSFIELALIINTSKFHDASLSLTKIYNNTILYHNIITGLSIKTFYCYR